MTELTYRGSQQSVARVHTGTVPQECAHAEVAITVDYEIYDFLGSNYVDIQEQMLGPVDAMMQICERYGAKLTLMFEGFVVTNSLAAS